MPTEAFESIAALLMSSDPYLNWLKYKEFADGSLNRRVKIKGFSLVTFTLYDNIIFFLRIFFKKGFSQFLACPILAYNGLKGVNLHITALGRCI